MTTTNDNEQRLFTNSRGYKVPESDMLPQDILKNELVVEHIAEAQRLSKAHDEFKRKVFSDIQDFVALLSDHYGIDDKSDRGNLTMTSFDGKSKIMIGIDDQIEFGVEIDLAKRLINEVIENELDGASAFLRQVVMDAFEANKHGSYNKTRILALRKYRRAHPGEKWKNAMKALDDGIIAGSSKTYIRFYERNQYGKFQQIPMVSTSL